MYGLARLCSDRTDIAITERIAHEKVEEQRLQLQEQEKQVALLRARIALLEGTNENGPLLASRQSGGSTVDDFSIKVCYTSRTRSVIAC